MITGQNLISFSEKNKNDIDSISQVINGLINIVEINSNIKMIYDLTSQIYNELLKQHNSLKSGEEKLKDKYLTPQGAMDYLGMSRGTFEKYRYISKIKINGYQLDGKTWFKKSDLDRFMLTYQAKSVGLA
jgi:hypothetical protein